MTQWSKLSPELHRAIFEILAADIATNEPHKPIGVPCWKDRHLPKYARVNKSWNSFFEEKIYGHLFLTSSTLPVLRSLTLRRRKFVKYIWLKIGLDKYTSPNCFHGNMEVKKALQRSANRITEAAVSHLFAILSKWEGHHVASEGLTIEISAYSASDRQHAFFNDLHFDTSPFATGPLEVNRPPVTCRGDGWVQGRRVKPPSLKSLWPLQIDLDARFRQVLPRVHVANRLVIRRQSRVLFVEPLRAMLESLPNLTSLEFEPWRRLHCYPATGEYLQDYAHCEAIRKFGSLDNLRDVTIFEDFNEEYDHANFDYPLAPGFVCHPELVRTPSKAIGDSLAGASQHLHKLAASYLIEAVDFLDACQADWIWGNLVSLHLTSRHLDIASPLHVNKLLIKAGEIAMRMPKLKIMDIWYGRRGKAHSFRYEATDGCSMIRWRGTKELGLDQDVRDAWSKVAELYTRRPLRVRHERIETAITSHAVAIRELGLEKHVVHPISLKQILHETERYVATSPDEISNTSGPA